MSDAFERPLSQDASGSVLRDEVTDLRMGARASVVNRTHRVVRERAKALAVRRNRIRSLWIPLAICSSLFVIICTAVWSALDAYDVTPTGVPDASNQFLVLCLWFFPVSMALLALVLFHRARKREVAG
ncbi:hypothetical protein RBB79_15500 [Tunturiibacter empetritectus]|uniref:Uncharacterized protein n=1 Tax=Tunturiibacter lichenicola TaxID=2051959 RepID=A0A852VIJ8_9BACT|nr:hypothetical protein [Edaphobacter lichenicola]NYF91021.1 hypothetical protein [Edaphobacter lichenicola]